MSVQLEVDANLNDEFILWRYMDLAKLISMLEAKAIWLARVDTLEDRHEGRFPETMRMMIEEAYRGFPKDEHCPVKSADDFQDFLVKNTFVSCWHKSIDENMVMWKVYGRETNAVAVQTTVRRFKNSVDSSELNGHSLLLKPIVYGKSENVRGELRYEECFFRKRPHFSFEQEVRISLDTYSHESPTKNTPLGFHLPAATGDFIESIYVHPDCDDWFVGVVNSITKKYAVVAKVKRGSYGNN
jgi:hypothetical protein